MSQGLEIQATLPAAPATVFAALSDTARLTAWFAEAADVSLPERRYDFWGRFTPETPDRERGRHPLLAVAEGERLRYGWRLRDADSVVDMTLRPHDGGTRLILRQETAPTTPDVAVSSVEDFWFLSLENLRRHLDGRAVVRCDYGGTAHGEIRHTIEIDGPPAAVFAALIQPEQLERWIASHATVEPVVGGRYELGWAGGGPVRILALTPDAMLAYSWPEETESVVTWTLEGSGGRTRLTIVHSGFAPERPIGGINTGWLNFLSWIKSLVEYGPAWRPPVLRLAPGLESFYAAAIVAAQATLDPS